MGLQLIEVRERIVQFALRLRFDTIFKQYQSLGQRHRGSIQRT